MRERERERGKEMEREVKVPPNYTFCAPQSGTKGVGVSPKMHKRSLLHPLREKEGERERESEKEGWTKS